MNFKVKCVECTDKSVFTVGNIYEVANGAFSNESGVPIYAWSHQGNGQGIDALNYWYGKPDQMFTAKFELVKEDKMFTKDDLKVNDWCVCKNGEVYRVVFHNDRKVLISERFHCGMQYFNSDLTAANNDVTDIVKVYRPKLCVDYQLIRCHYYDGKLVFDREKEIGCEPPTKEISVDEATRLLTEKFGQNVRIRVGE